MLGYNVPSSIIFTVDKMDCPPIARLIGVAPMRSQPVSNQVLEGDAKEAPVNTNVYPACPQAAAGYNNNRAADTIKQRNFITHKIKNARQPFPPGIPVSQCQ